MRISGLFGRVTLFLCFLLPIPPAASQVGCLTCHVAAAQHLLPGHQFATAPCSSCHRGDESAVDEVGAHAGLVASPGLMQNAAQTCGVCHKSHVDAVAQSPMHTGRGIVHKTRELLGDEADALRPGTLQTLGDGIPDGLMRKLCAGCHLGRDSGREEKAPVFRRGGGCLACHLGTTPGAGHPGLSARVGDDRCFGCHSRSGRIALNYAGLAEVDPGSAVDNPGSLARLADGRLVRRMGSDVHHRAGMACIDCHTGAGLMGFLAHGPGSGIDVRCADCHANPNPRITPSQWPLDQRGRLRDIPFPYTQEQPFLTTANGTPLWHIQLQAGEAYLYPKLGGAAIRIPIAAADHVPSAEGHRRLDCDTCHARWVPTCLGCHVEYVPDGQQWDYLENKITPGAWQEKRWEIDAGKPVLGLVDSQHIGVFTPGMIMTLAHPQLEQERFLRHFAPLSPHTSGKARACEDCHRSPVGLGLGKGTLSAEGEAVRFEPAASLLRDGLPADAWTGLAGDMSENDTDYPRPFSPQEIDRILRAHP